VNIFGYLRGEFGLGESARAYARALLSAGYPTELNALSLSIPHPLGDSSLDSHIRNKAPHPVNLIFVNPDYLLQAMAEIGESRLKGRYTIACWFWELERVPTSWLSAVDAVDEIMVASSFVENAFRGVTDKPILRVPPPICGGVDSGIGRPEFGLPQSSFIFLVTFDFHSSIHRKNPLAAIAAFGRAFPPREAGVCLVIKCSNGHLYPRDLAHLLFAASADPRIIVRDQVLEAVHLRALQRCADAYVSLHRAEGFGLGMAESMWMGKPVIATGWSGNTDFMTRENSCLVDFDLVPVKQGEYPESEDARWAQPDVEQAAGFMRRLVDEPLFASQLGSRAAADVRVNLSGPALLGELLSRLDALSNRVESCSAGGVE